MSGSPAALFVVGGFAGSGKSTVAKWLSTRLAAPRLSSDMIGGAIRAKLPGADNAFGAGFDVLFTLAEEFLTNGCTVLLDLNMGWEFQWRRYDEIVARHPEIHPVPVILDASWELCTARIESRFPGNMDGHGTLEEFLQIGHVNAVWNFLSTLDRPDVHRIDATRDVEQIVTEIVSAVGPRR